MKRLFISFVIVALFSIGLKAQTPVQISGLDCNAVNHDLFADLDAGKAVVLFFFMPACGSCPPPAMEIQTMANNIMAAFPGMITAYAMPYNNTTTCAQTASWVSSNGLLLYSPYDSGATQVAYYGGFGMPTVVLLGGSGANRRTLFKTQSYSTSDTTIMRDSILSLFGVIPAAVHDMHLPGGVKGLSIFPNPANDHITLFMDLEHTSDIYIDMVDISGRKVDVLAGSKQQPGNITKHISTEKLPIGIYTLRIRINTHWVNRVVHVLH